MIRLLPLAAYLALLGAGMQLFALLETALYAVQALLYGGLGVGLLIAGRAVYRHIRRHK